MLQIILTLAIYIALVIPVGTYMYHIAAKDVYKRQGDGGEGGRRNRSCP